MLISQQYILFGGEGLVHYALHRWIYLIPKIIIFMHLNILNQVQLNPYLTLGDCFNVT